VISRFIFALIALAFSLTVAADVVKPALIEISGELQEIMNDDQVVPQEVDTLLTHIRKHMETQ